MMRLFAFALALTWPLPFAVAQAPVPSVPTAQVVPEVLATYPHDSAAFTQGLLRFGGSLFESTGRYGQSSLRKVEPQTGEVLRQVSVPETFFAEGLARVGDRLIQLTWREGQALVYDLATFSRVGTFRYEGEGWGLCYDGVRLYMSDGSSTLTVRNPQTFETTGSLSVTVDGSPLPLLNELECVKDAVYANVWQTDALVEIDKTSGAVRAVIDASCLLSEAEAANADVLNGIAYNPERDSFYLTGKLWPKLFEVRLPQ